MNPFVGPRSFKRDLQDQRIFFGRDDETEEIVSLIFSHQLVLVYAQSGAGKTSIFNAQVIPTLEKNGFDVLPVARVGIGPAISANSPSSNADTASITNAYLLNGLQSLIPNTDRPLITDKSLSMFLKNTLPPKRNDRDELIPQVIIFDQFEEIFSVYPHDRWREQQQEFFEQITEALINNPLFRIVFIIREDYLAQLDPFVQILPESLRPRFRLERLRREAAYEAIEGPLGMTDLRLDKTIVETIVDNLLKIRIETSMGKSSEIKGEFVEPIQLQVVCQRLWNKLKTSQIDQINQDYFGYLGDVDKALEDFYVEAISEASKTAGVEEDTIRKWFEENLITSSGTRGIIHKGLESTGGIPNTAVDILEKKYLIRKEERAGAQWYELTHDRLIKPVLDSNKQWKDEREKEREKTFAKLWQKVIAVRVQKILLQPIRKCRPSSGSILCNNN